MNAQGSPQGYSDLNAINTRGEWLADAIILSIGLMAAIVGVIVLTASLPGNATPVSVTAITLYAIGLVSSFLCSALYNLAGEGRFKTRFRQYDHAAIFLLIAGTYTPVALLGVGGATGQWLSGIVWTCAISGAGLKLAAPVRFELASLVGYLALGWFGLAMAETLLLTISTRNLTLLGLGGILYSLGILVHLAIRLPYQKAIWHMLVTIAAACHYAAVLGIATQAP